MTHQEIVHYFGVNSQSNISLREQLEKRIADFLDAAPTGMVLPAERLLSKVLGISRVTVRNALSPHFVSGRITRQRRRGTIVAPKEMPVQEINELALGLPWKIAPPVQTLRFLSYETLPLQQRFWRKVIERFEQSYPRYKIELVLVNSVPNKDAFKDYLINEDIDIFIHSHVFGVPSSEIAMQLPERLLSSLCQENFLDVGVKGMKPEDFRLFPFHLEWCDTYWNEELAMKLGLNDVGKRLQCSEKIDMILQVLLSMPEDYSAGSHIWCQLAHHGLPGMLNDGDALLKQVSELSRLQGTKNAFLTTQQTPLDDVEKFISGKLLFLDAYTTQLQTIGIPQFATGRVPCALLCGRRFCHCQDLAIAPHCCNLEAATNFLAFLLTPEVQEMVWKIKDVPPIRHAEYLVAMKELYGFDEAAGIELKNNMYVFQHNEGEIEREIEFLLYDVRDELSQLIGGKMSTRDTVEKIQKKWNRKKQFLNQ